MHFVTTTNKELIQPKRKRRETTRSVEARPAKLTGWKSRRRKCSQKNRWRSLWNLHSLSGHLLSHRHLICASHLPHSHSPLQEWQTCLSHCSVSPLTCIATVFYLVSPLHCCLHDMFSKVQETFFFSERKIWLCCFWTEQRVTTLGNLERHVWSLQTYYCNCWTNHSILTLGVGVCGFFFFWAVLSCFTWITLSLALGDPSGKSWCLSRLPEGNRGSLRCLPLISPSSHCIAICVSY